MAWKTRTFHSLGTILVALLIFIMGHMVCPSELSHPCSSPGCIYMKSESVDGSSVSLSVPFKSIKIHMLKKWNKAYLERSDIRSSDSKFHCSLQWSGKIFSYVRSSQKAGCMLLRQVENITDFLPTVHSLLSLG